MSRPVHANAEATRRRILEQAVRLFSENGVGETSIRDIARASGVSLAMVHHYYFSKEKLLSACISSVYADLSGLQGRFEEVIARAGSGDDLLREAVIAGFRFARERRELVRLLLRITIARGTVAEGEPTLRRFLDTVSTRFGALTDRPAAALRLPLQSIVYLIARYSMLDDAEMEWVVGPDVVQRAGTSIRALENHIAECALRLLMVETRAIEMQRAAE
jgi:AcrR family transcriptional regulator